MKRPKVRSKARTAAKKKERELIARAKRLRDGPDPIIPECAAECRKCPFEKMRTKLLKLLKYRDNKRKLASLSNFGSDFTKAYAATLLLAAQQKAPYLAVARVGNKDIAYAQRGKAKKELLIGFQHYDEPDARLLAVADIARKNGLFIFSTKEKMICTGTTGRPPKQYVREAIGRMKYPFQKSADGYISVEAGDETILQVRWIPAEISIKVSRSRSSSKRNIASVILNRMLYPQNVSVLDMRIHPGFRHARGGDDCPLKTLTKVSRDLRDKHMSGKVSDREFIDMHLDAVREKGGTLDQRIFAVGMTCFDDDSEAFIESLRPNEVEREALRALLDNLNENIILDEASPSKVLDMFWREAGLEALKAVLHDEDAASRFYERSLSSEETPSHFVREAFQSAQREKILADLPKYKRLPPVARFCDRIARIYKTEGSAAAAKEIRRDSSREKAYKALEYAFLLALNEGKGEEWRYTEDERGFGVHLKSAAEGLLSAKPEDYDASLRNLLAMSGHSI
ncbi:MAG: hypothetical protein ACE5QW_08310 [Thermoplasmata archaeon]